MNDHGFGGPTGWNDPLGGPEWGWGTNGSPFGSGNSNNSSGGNSGCGCSIFTVIIGLAICGFIAMGIIWLKVKLWLN